MTRRMLMTSLGLLALGGCALPWQTDEEVCAEEGHAPGSPPFDACVAERRAAAARRRKFRRRRGPRGR